jgi:hypothetical protein
MPSKPARESTPEVRSRSPLTVRHPSGDSPRPADLSARPDAAEFPGVASECQKVRTTFPTALLSSRYRVASAASDAGNVRPTAARYLPLADRSTTSSRSLAERSDGTRRLLNPMIVDGFALRSSESILSVVPRSPALKPAPFRSTMPAASSPRISGGSLAIGKCPSELCHPAD